MRYRRLRIDDPKDLMQYSNACSDLCQSIILLDYARRVFQRQEDTRRVREIVNLLRELDRQCLYLTRSIIPDSVIHDYSGAIVRQCAALEEIKTLRSKTTKGNFERRLDRLEAIFLRPKEDIREN